MNTRRPGRRRRRVVDVDVVPAFRTHPLHPRGHVSFYLSLPLFSATLHASPLLLVRSLLFFRSFFSLSLSLSLSFLLCLVLSGLQHVHRCLKSSGRQADLRYATARVWALARSPREREERRRTGSEKDSEKTKRTTRERRDEEQLWGRKETATDGGRVRERERGLKKNKDGATKRSRRSEKENEGAECTRSEREREREERTRIEGENPREGEET